MLFSLPRNNHIFTRIFRFIGGICVVIFTTNNSLNTLDSFYEIIQYYIIIYGAVFMVYFLIIIFTKIFYGLYIVIYHKEKFEVRN